MAGRKDSIDLWLAALQERLNEDVRSKLPTLDKELLAVKLNELIHQVRGPSEIPYGMKVYRLELSVARRQNRRYSDGQWIECQTPKVADFFELRVVNDQWEVILSMEARMADPVAMRRLFQFVKSTRMTVLTLKFSQDVYTGKLRSHLLQALEQPDLQCVEIYGTTLPDILLEFLTFVSKNQRKCFFTSLSILGGDHDETPLSQEAAQRIAEMLLHFKLRVLTLEGVCIEDEAAAASLADGIQRCLSLESLDLTRGTKGMANVSVQRIIGQGIAHNESLKKLKLSA
jgi:hypothetical protein